MASKHEVTDRRRDLSSKVVELTLRVLALREKTYPGHGYNWDWTRSAGRLLCLLNDYYTQFELSTLLAAEATYETLLEAVVEAESKVEPLTGERFVGEKNERDLIAEKLPELASRVFALRTQHYKGCGFHWSLVRSIGGLLELANSRESEITLTDSIALEVGYESLVESVTAAESS